MVMEQNYKRYNVEIPPEERRKYSLAKAQAKFRQEEWAFTADTWYQQWIESGVMQHRGKQPHQYCMVRLDTIEAWGPHNCIIVPRRMHLKKCMYETKTKNYTDWQPKHGVSK